MEASEIHQLNDKIKEIEESVFKDSLILSDLRYNYDLMILKRKSTLEEEYSANKENKYLSNDDKRTSIAEKEHLTEMSDIKQLDRSIKEREITLRHLKRKFMILSNVVIAEI